MTKAEDFKPAVEIFREKGYVPYYSDSTLQNGPALLWKPADHTWAAETVFDPDQPTFLTCIPSPGGRWLVSG